MISIRPGIIGGRKAKCEINAAKRASASESESIKFATVQKSKPLIINLFKKPW